MLVTTRCRTTLHAGRVRSLAVCLKTKYAGGILFFAIRCTQIALRFSEVSCELRITNYLNAYSENPYRVIGAVAQLGERMTGSHEVRGSIPLGSTNKFNNLEAFLLLNKTYCSKKCSKSAFLTRSWRCFYETRELSIFLPFSLHSESSFLRI